MYAGQSFVEYLQTLGVQFLRCIEKPKQNGKVLKRVKRKQRTKCHEIAYMMCISNCVYQKHLILRKICMLFILLYDWYEPLLQKASYL